MPSSSVTIILCFLAFLFGQVFNSICTSLKDPTHINVNIEPVIAAAPVHTGFTFATLVWVVALVLLVHDLVVVVVIRLLLKDRKCAPQAILKCLPAAVADNVVIPRRNRLLLLPSIAANPSPAVSRSPSMVLSVLKPFNFWPAAFLSIPRPFWRPQHAWYQFSNMAVIARAVLPLMVIESPPALALVTMRASTQQLPLFTLATGRRVGIPIFKASFIRLYGFSTGSITPTERTLKNSVEEEIEETLHEDARINTSPPPQDASACTRSSRAPLLRHVAAAALLRKLRFKILEDEPCHARVQEITDVEEVDERSDGCKESNIVEAAAVEEVEKVVEVVEELVGEVVAEAVHAVEEVEVLETAVIEQAEKVVPGLTPDTSVDNVSSPTHDEKLEVQKTIYEDIPFYEELDDLPSYEEFVMGAPPEPLFADRIPEVVAFAIFRPPSLAFFASRTGAKPVNTRASHRQLLARLSVRTSADVAESS
ncbi:hypothetical protein B0H12DRAFT_195418 [Mycena haematopus]|nr:hypothetical protein B0H12DRAFT_195418 [Mycena haematopus]